MKRIILLLTSGLLALNSFAQRVKTIETDSATYFVDTEVFSSDWGGINFNGSTLTGINSLAYSESNGQRNTEMIVKAFGVGAYPAHRCDTLNLNNKVNWYLPSKNESKIVYDQFDKLGIFKADWYWTSTDLDGKPYDNLYNTFDRYAWVKWFGCCEGDIGNGMIKFNVSSSFCISKEMKLTTGIMADELLNDKKEEYLLYNLNGKQTSKILNTVLIKKYLNGPVEKVIYTE